MLIHHPVVNPLIDHLWHSNWKRYSLLVILRILLLELIVWDHRGTRGDSTLPAFWAALARCCSCFCMRFQLLPDTGHRLLLCFKLELCFWDSWVMPALAITVFTVWRPAFTLFNTFIIFFMSEASMAASAGETDRDLAWTQLAQKLGVYNII